MQYDALFVINQDADLPKLGEFCESNRFEKVFLLSTHHLFPHERDAFLSEYTGQASIIPMAFLLEEKMMDHCDNMTSDLIEKGVIAPHSQGAVMLQIKNQAVWARLSNMHSFRSIFSTPGLGISYQVWEDLGALFMEPRKYDCQTEKTKDVSVNVSVFHENTTRYLFLTSTKRLSLTRSPDSIKKFNMPVSILKTADTDKLEKFLHTILPLNNGEFTNIISTTIHEYDSFMHGFNLPVAVFVDGYHPPNYNKAYMDAYGDVRFLSSDPISVEWFKRFGRTTGKAPSFISPARMRKPKKNTSGHVLLALNHAGDWSALIERSDTDIVIEAFAEVAARVPNLSFVIRPHPTMAHPAHEGSNSINRIREFVAARALPNLTMSSNTSVEDDINGALLVCSEYSQVLITAWLQGIYGISVNLTQRRSFMQAYSDMGFPEASSTDELFNFVVKMQTQKTTPCPEMVAAVNSYNKKLEIFYSAST